VHAAFPVATVRAEEDALMARLPDGALMQRAASALAVECAAVLDRVYGTRVTLLVGAGNNGGDALYAGAALARRGARVTALLLDRARAHPGGLAALLGNGGRARDADPAAVAADLVVDGILGIGGSGGLRRPAAALAEAADACLTVAVDLPSGVAADTGAVDGDAVRADVTVTFGLLKPGLVLGRGAELAGQVRLVDIGLSPAVDDAALRVLEASDVQAVLPVPSAADDKYTRGVVGVVAGSQLYGGAGVLCTGAAIHGGAGMVRYAGSAPDAIRARFPEVVVQSGAAPEELRVQAWVIGPGIGTDDAAGQLLRSALATDFPVIIDADGLTVLAAAPELVRRRSAPTVLTPHDREFARLFGEVGSDRLAAARRAASSIGATVLLKGNATVVAAPDGAAFANPTGTPWLATAGSGDVLSGLLGSLLAAGLPAPMAAASAAYLHGVAGQRAAAAGPASALDVLAEVRGAFRVVATG
jgi:ADP-dependent NAD(P)H-hydrate dehydratase / NAD(P)H-hydrate epimerase